MIQAINQFLIFGISLITLFSVTRCTFPGVVEKWTQQTENNSVEQRSSQSNQGQNTDSSSTQTQPQNGQGSRQEDRSTTGSSQRNEVENTPVESEQPNELEQRNENGLDADL